VKSRANSQRHWSALGLGGWQGVEVGAGDAVGGGLVAAALGLMAAGTAELQLEEGAPGAAAQLPPEQPLGAYPMRIAVVALQGQAASGNAPAALSTSAPSVGATACVCALLGWKQVWHCHPLEVTDCRPRMRGLEDGFRALQRSLCSYLNTDEPGESGHC
jgi:hypothetical protein